MLVRSVEGGSPAAAAGVKAGDVILKVNNEAVHDMADWQRGMRPSGAKLSVSVWRDKHEQSSVMSVPGRRQFPAVARRLARHGHQCPAFAEQMDDAAGDRAS